MKSLSIVFYQSKSKWKNLTLEEGIDSLQSELAREDWFLYFLLDLGGFSTPEVNFFRKTLDFII